MSLRESMTTKAKKKDSHPDVSTRDQSLQSPDKYGHLTPSKWDIAAGKPAPSLRGRGRNRGR